MLGQDKRFASLADSALRRPRHGTVRRFTPDLRLSGPHVKAEIAAEGLMDQGPLGAVGFSV
jgi:hypothetical protein